MMADSSIKGITFGQKENMGHQGKSEYAQNNLKYRTPHC